MNLKGKLLTAMAIGVIGAMSLNLGNVHAEQDSINEVEPNDTFETANTIEITEAGTYEISGCFKLPDGTGDDDYFKLVFTNAGKFNVKVENTTDVNRNCTYEVYDSQHYKLSCEYGYMHKANDAYYIYPKNGGFGFAADNYKITVTEDESKAYEQEANNTPETATLLDNGVVVTGSIEASGAGDYGEDYYKMVVPKNKYATLTFGGDAEAVYYDCGNSWKVTVINTSKKNKLVANTGVNWEDTVKIKNSSEKNSKTNDYDTKFYAGTYYIKVETGFLGITRPYNISYKLTDLPKTNISKLSSKKATVTAKWAKKNDITGYQIQYSANKNFKSAKTITVKSLKTVSTTIKKLKVGKNYYVRIRTYKNFDKTNYYSSWSKVNSIKIKK